MRTILFGLAALGVSAGSGHAASWWDNAQVTHHAAALRAQWAAQQHPGKIVEPSLIAGKVLTPTVNVTVAPGQAIVSVTLDSGTVGYEEIGVELSSPDGMHFVESFGSPPAYPPNRKQTFAVEVVSPFGGGGLTLYSEPGNWTVAGAFILAKDGSQVSYTASQIASLFPSVTVAVTNPNTPDTTPPTISHGKILTPTVSLSGASPFFAVRVNAADDISGVLSVGVNLTSASGGFGAVSALLAPLSSGKVTAYADLAGSSVAPGTYTITGFSVCDAAQNCESGYNPAQVQAVFGNDVTVQITD